MDFSGVRGRNCISVSLIRIPGRKNTAESSAVEAVALLRSVPDPPPGVGHASVTNVQWRAWNLQTPRIGSAGTATTASWARGRQPSRTW